LRERAEILDIAPDGTRSAGGTCRLFPSADGYWVAINLARETDLEMLPAWMGHELEGPTWDAVADHISWTPAGEAVDRAQLVGIAAAFAVECHRWRSVAEVRYVSRATVGGTPRVLDLSTLWAGPLCARLLAGLGAEVMKVETPDRPDGARGGPPEFWDLMNGNKVERTMDIDEIRQWVQRADVVVTSARPRAIEHLDLGLEHEVRRRGMVWVAITGYGYFGRWNDRVAFGDDAAVSGGLALYAGGPESPVFVGDAPADPLAGLQGAVTAAALLHAGRGGMIDVSMRESVAAALRDDDRYPAEEEVA
jgi:crotonobetainyl-CoA:carnitine CoA-transferase CaiB-like acyl-CoA transferase